MRIEALGLATALLGRSAVIVAEPTSLRVTESTSTAAIGPSHSWTSLGLDAGSPLSVSPDGPSTQRIIPTSAKPLAIDCEVFLDGTSALDCWADQFGHVIVGQLPAAVGIHLYNLSIPCFVSKNLTCDQSWSNCDVAELLTDADRQQMQGYEHEHLLELSTQLFDHVCTILGLSGLEDPVHNISLATTLFYGDTMDQVSVDDYWNFLNDGVFAPYRLLCDSTSRPASRQLPSTTTSSQLQQASSSTQLPVIRFDKPGDDNESYDPDDYAFSLELTKFFTNFEGYMADMDPDVRRVLTDFFIFFCVMTGLSITACIIKGTACGQQLIDRLEARIQALSQRPRRRNNRQVWPANVGSR